MRQSDGTEADSRVSLINLYQERALLLWVRTQLAARFRQQRNEDLRNFRANSALSLARDVNSGDASQVYKSLKPKRPVNRDKGFKMPRPLPGLTLQGTCQSDHNRLRYIRVWEKHFAAIEHSCVVDMEAIKNYAARQQQQTPAEGFSLEETPALNEFEQSIRQLSWRKAPGFDGLGAEVWQSDVAANRKHLFALFLKATARRYLPIQYRGGYLIPLYKNRGSTSQPASFRGILLQNTAAKIFAKTWRRNLAYGLSNVAAPLQLGCRKGLGVSGAHLPLRLHLDSCASRGESAAILFLDLKAAYYSVVKEMYSSVGNSSCERFLAALFRRLQLPDEALDDFVQLVSTTCLLDDANIGATLQAMVRSTLEQSWYQIPNSPDVYAPSTGSRPGDPLADVLFSYAMADVLTEVYTALAGSPDILQVPPDYPAGTTWADDTCVFISGDPNTLEQRTGVVYSIVHEALTKRGLTLALGPYKTAVIMAFRGPNGKRLHRNLFTRQHPKVISCLEYGAAASLEVQFVYKHLGSLVDVTGSLLPEIRARGGKAFHAVRPLLSSCLANPAIDIKRRRQILQALGLSVATHNVGTWRKLTKTEFEVWTSQIWKLYGCLVPRDFSEQHPHLGLDYVAAVADNFLPGALLHAERLRLLCQIARYPDDSLICALQENFNSCGTKSWWACVLEAFDWLRQVAGSTEVIKDLEALTEPPQIFQMPTTFASDLHRALKVARRTNKHFLQQLADLKWADDTQRLILKVGGWHVPSPIDATMDSPPTRVACPECSRYFRDAASLATHRFKAHNVKVAARRFSPTTTCMACGKGFSTRPRLIVHLQYSSRRCLPWLLMHSAAIDEETAKSLDEEAAVAALQERRSGVRSNLSRLPVNYEGSTAVPAVNIDPIAFQERPVMEGIAPIQEAQLTFIAKWKDVEGVWPLCEHTWWLFTDDLIKAMDQCPYECHQSFAGRLTDMVDEVCWRQDDFELVLEAQDRLAAILHSYAPSRKLVRQPLKSKEEVLRGWEEEYGSLPVWMGLRTSSTRPRCGDDSNVLFPSRLAAIEHSWQEEVLAWRPGDQVPRQVFPSEVFYLILFSGHRRADDIGSQLWAWTSKAVWYGLSAWTCASTTKKATFWMHGSKTYGKGRSWTGW